MYEELVKRLRDADRITDGRITLWGDAANAIEEMQRILDIYGGEDGINAVFKERDALIETVSHQRDILMKYGGETEIAQKMERDFKAYISDQVHRTAGVYACNVCRHRDGERSGPWGGYCEHIDCDGVSGWEYGNPPKVNE